MIQFMTCMESYYIMVFLWLACYLTLLWSFLWLSCFQRLPNMTCYDFYISSLESQPGYFWGNLCNHFLAYVTETPPYAYASNFLLFKVKNYSFQWIFTHGEDVLAVVSSLKFSSPKKNVFYASAENSRRNHGNLKRPKHIILIDTIKHQKTFIKTPLILIKYMFDFWHFHHFT